MKNPMVWVDLEMTGLNPDTDVILEIACIVTDGDLDEVVEGPNLVIHASDEELEMMVPLVLEMHSSSGLADAVRESTLSVGEAEQQVLEFVRLHVPEAHLAPLAGNSVHADRAFMRRYMKDLDSHLHYRIVDVSTIKELAKRWLPEVVANAPQKHGDHRALADIQESIGELRYYRSEFFRSPASESETAT